MGMKKCPVCGTMTWDHIEKCPKCKKNTWNEEKLEEKEFKENSVLIELFREPEVANNLLNHFSLKEISSLLLVNKKIHEVTKKHVIKRVRGNRTCITNLFANGKQLYNWYERAEKCVPEKVRMSHFPNFEIYKNFNRAGFFLSFIATAIQNECDGLCFHTYGNRIDKWIYNVIVVTTLIVIENKPVLIIALNGGGQECRKIYEDHCCNVLSKTMISKLGLKSVDVVHGGEEPNKDFLKFFKEKVKKLTKIEMENWLKEIAKLNYKNWHGEQKIIEYVRRVYGFDMRKSIIVLGISHSEGPCNFHQSHHGQGCKDYLQELDKLDYNFLGEEVSPIIGFWLHGGKSKDIFSFALTKTGGRVKKKLFDLALGPVNEFSS